MGAEVEIGDRRRLDVGDDRLDAADVGEQRLTELAEDADVDVPGRADRADERRALALEDRGEPGDAAFDGLLEDDVGLVSPVCGRAAGVVCDLHRQRRAAGDAAPAGHRRTGQRAEGGGSRRRRRRLVAWSSVVVLRGGVAPAADEQPARTTAPAAPASSRPASGGRPIGGAPAPDGRARPGVGGGIRRGRGHERGIVPAICAAAVATPGVEDARSALRVSAPPRRVGRAR